MISNMDGTEITEATGGTGSFERGDDEITELLRRHGAGHSETADELFPALYGELRRIAAACARRERADHTLQATAIVHEAYVRLVEQPGIAWQSRQHFLGLAARVMRRVLVDYARERGRAKRGGGADRVELAEALSLGSGGDPDLVALDDALRGLGAVDERLVRVVELRFFAGLTLEETARHLGVSPMTVTRDWRRAKAWLYEELHGDGL
jgi:RNA polymerase sigma factor (TIGR02999 family)